MATEFSKFPESFTTGYRLHEFSDRDSDIAAGLSKALNRRNGESTMPHRFAMQPAGKRLFRVTDTENGSFLVAEVNPQLQRKIRVIHYEQGML